MTKQTKLVLITATVLVGASALLIVYSSDKQNKRYNAALTNPKDAITQINRINQSAGMTAGQLPTTQ